uniref:Lactosylceramide alpha-2,3-sialyltransferase n=1 Tax=Scleropages formosus TaxID=113540 RepID=A0A8C9SDL5_SCLFO
MVPLIVLALILLGLIIPFGRKTSKKSYQEVVDENHRQLVHSHVKAILDKKCRPAFTRSEMKSKFKWPGQVKDYFLREASPTGPMFKYPPPFGFYNMKDKLHEILSLLPKSTGQESSGNACQRCVVVGNGGILRGLRLGSLIDQFDIIIRLNSGPVQGFSKDVGTRTSIRMSYPEGSPTAWEDQDPRLLFVAVVYKSVDFNWLRAMITRKQSFWDWLFFWQKVPSRIPIELSQFRILNPEIIRETALDLLQLPAPRIRLWGWDQNVPTLGFSALTLASYMCDEVSIAGFGYNLTDENALLHYYDTLPMRVMLKQSMHNVNREHLLLKSLAEAGVISDLTGGVHCSFCSR